MSAHRVRIEPLGRTIMCSADQTVLDACLRNGIWIQHGCSRGTCGTCKGVLVSGTTDMGDASDAGITQAEVRAGKILLCSTLPKTDLVVAAEVLSEPGLQLYPVRDYTACVVSIEECAKDTRRILLDLDQPLDFLAGQYICVRVPRSNVRRAYSLANPPSDRRRVELHVRRAPEGEATDRWLFRSLETGHRIDLSGPYGNFRLRTDLSQPAIMVAGGTGLAPLKSMIRHVLEGGHPHELHLYHGARTQEDLYDFEFFSRLAGAHPRQFTYTPCLSESVWAGASGPVSEVVGAHFKRARGYTAYVCGPSGMVEAATRTLISLRVPSRDIFRETFYDRFDRTLEARWASVSAKRQGPSSSSASQKVGPDQTVP
jgi:phenol hydroxylase P5 protein